MITIKVTIMIFASTPIHDIVLFIISTPASLNACTLQSQVDSDWLSFFFFCSSAGKKNHFEYDSNNFSVPLSLWLLRGAVLFEFRIVVNISLLSLV